MDIVDDDAGAEGFSDVVSQPVVEDAAAPPHDLREIKQALVLVHTYN